MIKYHEEAHLDPVVVPSRPVKFLVGIKRRWWFGYRTYVCKGAFIRGFTTLHASDGTKFEGPIQPHLVLLMHDGTEHYVTDIENRDWFSKEI